MLYFVGCDPCGRPVCIGLKVILANYYESLFVVLLSHIGRPQGSPLRFVTQLNFIVYITIYQDK